MDLDVTFTPEIRSHGHGIFKRWSLTITYEGNFNGETVRDSITRDGIMTLYDACMQKDFIITMLKNIVGLIKNPTQETPQPGR